MNDIQYGMKGEFSSLEEWAEKTRDVPFEKIQEDWDMWMQVYPAGTSVGEHHRWQTFLAVRYKEIRPAQIERLKSSCVNLIRAVEYGYSNMMNLEFEDLKSILDEIKNPK